MKQVHLLLLIVCASLILETCAPSKMVSVRDYLPTGYGNVELVKASHFKLVDDFPGRLSQNRLGGVLSFDATQGSKIEVSFIEEEAVRKQGFALKVSYELVSKGSAYVREELKDLDVTQARGLSFWFAYKVRENPRIFVQLTDRAGRQKRFRFDTNLLPGSKNWQEVFIPTGRFRGVDFNGLKSLDFIVESTAGEEGVFFLDEVSFFGEEELFLRSLKDNLYGFPTELWVSEAEAKRLLQRSDEKLLDQIARDTWKYFEKLVDRRHQLPVDHVKLSWLKHIGDFTSPTNIGFYYLSCIAAYELGFISRPRAFWRIASSLKTLEKLPRWKGFFHNYYNTTSLQVTNRFISTVDNAWLVACLWVVRESFPKELAKRINRIVERMDFDELYDPGPGQFHIGYDEEKARYSESHYAMLMTEARLASLVALAKGDVEREHWFRMFRTLPRDWGWQTQIPRGSAKVYKGINVFEGYYEYNGKKVVPSWGGSLFEFLAPSLLVKEAELAPRSLGQNNRIATEIHVDYALRKKGHPVWGLAPCSIESGARGGYREFGIKEIGAKGYPDEAVIAPYASFLALDWSREESLKNIRSLLERYPIYGEYGFYDSVRVDTGKPNLQYLALDQGMILVALANYLRRGVLRERFHEAPEVRRVQNILSEEEFFE